MIRYRPFIPERVGYELHRFGLEYDEGWVFWRILRLEDTEYLNYDRNWDEIADAATTGAKEFEDANSKKFLYVESQDAYKYVKHVGIGFNPELWCFPQYPSGKKLRQVLGTDTIQAGEARGMVRGMDSPYPEPTEKMEFLFPFGMKLMLNFYNPALDGSPAPIQPSTHILMRTYLIEILDPADPDDRSIISAMARGLAAWSPRSMGRIDSLETYSTLKDKWNVEEIPNLRDARKLATSGNAKEAARHARRGK